MTINLGYACINETLKKDKITCNRGMIKRTFQDKGIAYASELALINVKALKQIIEWNNANDISVYRMTSCLFPWMSEYDIFDLPDIDAIADTMATAGKIAMDAGQRLSFHPGPFNCLASPNDDVVRKTIAELNAHSLQMDLMGLPVSPRAKINIHVGGAYGEHDNAMARFCKAVDRLGATTQLRLTVENDDKASMYSVQDLYDGIYKRIGIPIVFDYHHHGFCTGDLTEQKALELAISTWPDDIVPAVHYSESRRREQLDESIRPQAHSDYITDYINTYGHRIDIMVEAKHKELAVQQYKETYETSN